MSFSISQWMWFPPPTPPSFSYYIIVGLSPFKGSLSALALIEIPSLPSSLFKIISPIMPFFTFSYQFLKVLKSLSFYIELFLTPIFLLWLSSSPSFPSRQKFMYPQHISTIWPSSASYLFQLTTHLHRTQWVFSQSVWLTYVKVDTEYSLLFKMFSWLPCYLGNVWVSFAMAVSPYRC